jgi:hypothetical protein
VIFQPEWGVPDGIKMKELLPRLKRASSQGGGFFDQLFGGGSSSGGARVLAAYKLTPSLNGRPIDANSVDWNSVDIRRFSFVQPAGSENPLGQVKFRFPNRHDVYMHDTLRRPCSIGRSTLPRLHADRKSCVWLGALAKDKGCR